MDQVTLERTKWISRTIAVFSLLYVFWLLLALVVTTYNRASSSLPSALPLPSAYAVFDICIELSLVCFLSWVGIRLWRHPSCKDIWLWALVPSIIIYRVLNLFLFFGYLVNLEYMFLVIHGFRFVILLISGFIYWVLKRGFCRVLKTKEQINPKILKWGGRVYFLFLSYTSLWLFWGVKEAMLSETCFDSVMSSDSISQYSHCYAMEFVFFVLWIVVTVLVYKICVRQFVTKPLKGIQESPKDLNNGSPGCSAGD